jgi:hypothetical protein
MGLESFVNCGDSAADYEALAHNWLDFWPLSILHWPYYDAQNAGFRFDPISLDEQLEKWEDKDKTETLAWHPFCRELFLFYRDSLRTVWRGTHVMGEDEFLLGLTDLNEEACKLAKNGGPDLTLLIPLELDLAWRVIVKQFPTAIPESRVQIGTLWKRGDFSFIPDNNDFQKAFYLLFRQSWRARVCPRSKRFFVARKPKQIFCTTRCSAGNRNASKRSWWKRVGAKRRAKQRRAVSKNSRERKSR